MCIDTHNRTITLENTKFGGEMVFEVNGGSSLGDFCSVGCSVNKTNAIFRAQFGGCSEGENGCYCNINRGVI